MNQNYQMLPDRIEIHIHKPLYANFCYLRKTYLDNAIATHKKLFVTIPQGRFEVDPKWQVKTGKPMSKVFLRPDEPMLLVGNHVKIIPDEEYKKPEQKITEQPELL